MDHQSNKGNSNGTNCTIGTKGQVECTPTQPGAIKDTISRHDAFHFTQWITNRIRVIPLVPIVPLVPMGE